MACGCVPVGFTGLGGFEYMRNPNPHPLPGLFEPAFALADKPWGGNGFFVADGDILGMAGCLAHAVSLTQNGQELWTKLIENGYRAAQFYTHQTWDKRIAALWQILENTYSRP
jgi:glycosyltransferase involved in cell wall biosynthesis